MKKLLLILTLCLLCAFCLTACKKDETPAPDTPVTDNQTSDDNGQNDDNQDDDNQDDDNQDDDHQDDVVYSEGLQFTSNGDGTCYVSGIGACADTELNIPAVSPDGDRVTAIGDGAFHWTEQLTSITIPDGVVTIGEHAFSECYNLVSVTIPDSVTTINDSAFYFCGYLESITIPAGVTYIGEAAFSYVESLKSITVDANNPNYKSVDGNLYTKDGKSLIQYAAANPATEFVIPDGVTAVEYAAFALSVNLESITIPASVTTIDEIAFYYCISLKSITIPDSVTLIGNTAFGSCSSLAGITVGENNPNYKSVDGNLYTKDGKVLIQYALGKTDAQFTIPDGVITVSKYAVNDALNLESVIIPDGVTTIGNSAFYGCERLASIVIPDSVTSMGDFAFNFTAFYDNADNWEDGVLYIGNHLISVDESLSGVCVVKEGTKTIAGNAFYLCGSITGIIIPEGVVTIGNSAFLACSGLTSVTLPSSLTTIGENAFMGCMSITSILIPEGVTEIGAGAFSYCFGITDVYYEGSEEAWAELYDGTGLEAATIHYNYEGIHYNYEG